MAKTYYLRCRNGRRVIGTLNKSIADGAAVVQARRANLATQQWMLEPAAESGYFFIVNKASGKALHVSNWGAEPLIPTLDIRAKTEEPQQLWRLEESDDGYKFISSKLSRENMKSAWVLTVPMDKISKDGTPIYLAPDQLSGFGGKNQEWFLVAGPGDDAYGEYFKARADTAITLKASLIPDITAVEDLPAMANMPPPQDTHDAILRGIVLGATALGCLIATVATGGGAAVTFALLGGGVSLAGNAAWLWWPTQDYMSYITYVNDRVNEQVRLQSEAELLKVSKPFTNRIKLIHQALDGMRKGTLRQNKFKTAYDLLDDWERDLTKARVTLTSINSQVDPAAPELAIRCFIEYFTMHHRILLAMYLLSNEYTGMNFAEWGREKDLVCTFLSESRSALVKFCRMRQSYFAGLYSIEPDFSRLPVEASAEVSRNGVVIAVETLLGGIPPAEEMRQILDRHRTGEVNRIYSTDVAHVVYFNAVLKALTSIGMSLPEVVAPISQNEIRWPQYL
nr:RICIN domain-containing protein [Archangium sp.]